MADIGEIRLDHLPLSTREFAGEPGVGVGKKD
jgi:hypothetical protein